MSEYEIVPLRAFADNYIWALRDERCAAVVDPGDAQPVLDYLGREKLELTAILNTHHTRTHIAFYGAGMLYCGDTLFAVGCGRLFEGTPRQMFESLSRLTALPDDTRRLLRPRVHPVEHPLRQGRRPRQRRLAGPRGERRQFNPIYMIFKHIWP